MMFVVWLLVAYVAGALTVLAGIWLTFWYRALIEKDPDHLDK